MPAGVIATFAYSGLSIAKMKALSHLEVNMDQNFTAASSTHATTAEEGTLTKRIEQYSAKVPSLGYFGLALGSLFLSAGIATFSKRKSLANFVGLWVPSLMLVGIYNKLVKLEGSDRNDVSNLH